MEEYRYNRLTWEEMNDAIAMQKVVMLPVGSTEQHGPHLPLDTDTRSLQLWRRTDLTRDRPSLDRAGVP